MSLEALIFDVDGTLADTERDGHRIAFNKAFKDAGYDWDWTVELYGDLLTVTGGKERIDYFLNKYKPEFEKPLDYAYFLRQLHLAKNAHYAKMLRNGEIVLRPGVKRLIDEARAIGMRIAISTTTSPENVDALLSNTLGPDSMSWFEVIGAGDIVPSKKPAPDIYNFVLEEMNLSPAQCMAFEDSSNGVKSSLAAKIPTVITINDYTKAHDFSGAVLVVDQMGEPNEPMSVISGDAHGHGYLNIDLIKALHAR